MDIDSSASTLVGIPKKLFDYLQNCEHKNIRDAVGTITIKQMNNINFQSGLPPLSKEKISQLVNISYADNNGKKEEENTVGQVNIPGDVPPEQDTEQERDDTVHHSRASFTRTPLPSTLTDETPEDNEVEEPPKRKRKRKADTVEPALLEEGELEPGEIIEDPDEEPLEEDDPAPVAATAAAAAEEVRVEEPEILPPPSTEDEPMENETLPKGPYKLRPRKSPLHKVNKWIPLPRGKLIKGKRIVSIPKIAAKLKKLDKQEMNSVPKEAEVVETEIIDEPSRYNKWLNAAEEKNIAEKEELMYIKVPSTVLSAEDAAAAAVAVAAAPPPPSPPPPPPPVAPPVVPISSPPSPTPGTSASALASQPAQNMQYLDKELEDIIKQKDKEKREAILKKIAERKALRSMLKSRPSPITITDISDVTETETTNDYRFVKPVKRVPTTTHSSASALIPYEPLLLDNNSAHQDHFYSPLPEDEDAWFDAVERPSTSQAHSLPAITYVAENGKKDRKRKLLSETSEGEKTKKSTIRPKIITRSISKQDVPHTVDDVDDDDETMSAEIKQIKKSIAKKGKTKAKVNKAVKKKVVKKKTTTKKYIKNKTNVDTLAVSKEQQTETDEELEAEIEKERNLIYRRTKKREAEIADKIKERKINTKLAAPKKGRLLRTSDYGHYSNLI